MSDVSGGSAAPATGSPTTSTPVGAGDGARQAMPLESNTTRSTSTESRDAPPAKQGETKAEAEARLKVKRGGKEAEYTAAELAKMVSDDYEHEFSGPDGKSVKKNWQAVTRSVQMSEGAMEKMREAAAARQELAQQREWGAKNVPEYLQAHLGVQDFEGFIYDHANRLLQRNNELTALQLKDPYEYQRRVDQEADRRAEQKRAWERHQFDQQQSTRAESERVANAERIVGDALKEAKCRVNKDSLEIANKIWNEHMQVGYKLTLQDLAALTKQEYNKKIHEELDALDEDGLLELLGDDRRAKLRELEIYRAKGQKKEERKAEREERQEAREAAPTPVRGLNERDFNKRFGRVRA